MFQMKSLTPKRFIIRFFMLSLQQSLIFHIPSKIISFCPNPSLTDRKILQNCNLSFFDLYETRPLLYFITNFKIPSFTLEKGLILLSQTEGWSCILKKDQLWWIIDFSHFIEIPSSYDLMSNFYRSKFDYSTPSMCLCDFLFPPRHL